MPPYDTLPPYTPWVDSDALATTVQVNCLYDSAFVPQDHAEPVPRKSLFTHHLLPVRHESEMAVGHDGTPGWYLGGIALALLFLCLFLRAKQLRLLDLLQSLVSERAMARVLREANLTRAITQAPIALIMLFPVCLVASKVLMPATSPLSILNFLVIYVAACAVYYLRNGIYRFVGEAFLNSEAMHLYLTSNYVYHLAYGIVATALAFFVCFTGPLGGIFFYILAGIVGILAVMRFVRGVQLILTHAKSPKLYLFYYLCTLEIVPIIVLAHGAISW